MYKLTWVENAVAEMGNINSDNISLYDKVDKIELNKTEDETDKEKEKVKVKVKELRDCIDVNIRKIKDYKEIKERLEKQIINILK